MSDFRQLCSKFSNWGRWGDTDELGTLNLVTANSRRAAAQAVELGTVLSLALSLGDIPSDISGLRRPIGLMLRDGGDALIRDVNSEVGATGEVDRFTPTSEDVWLLSSHSGTHWDALAHVFDLGMMYNGAPASLVTSAGASRGAISAVASHLVGRAVLLDLPNVMGLRHLPPGHAISGIDLDRAAVAHGVQIRHGDIVLVRTGWLKHCRAQSWRDYLGSSPGIGLEAIDWLWTNGVAAVATDTWGFEVIPSQLNLLYGAVHIACLVHLGLTIGEMFVLDDLAENCMDDGRYEMLLTASALPMPGAVGSPTNPIVLR